MGFLVIERSDGGVSVRVGVEAGDDHAAEAAQWASRPKQIARGWTVTAFAYSETDPRPDREFRDSWAGDGGGGIQIPLTNARIAARRIMVRHVRDEKAALLSLRDQAIVEGDTTLVGQIDTRSGNLDSTIIPQIRDAIAAASTVGELKTVRSQYLASRPQRIKDEIG